MRIPDGMGSEDFTLHWKSRFPPLLWKMAKVAIIIYIVLFLLDTFTSINLRTILASLGILGLGVALAAREIFANVLGGIFIAIDRPFDIGDHIKIGDHQDGYVKELNLRTTIITAGREKYIVPNKMMTDNIICVSKRREDAI
jgi:MscS family membrane protein